MMPLLIILTGVLCGALPTVLWWRERKERLSCEGRLSWFKVQLRADDREKVAWRLFMKKLAKHTNTTKNCKECGMTEIINDLEFEELKIAW